MVNFRYIPEVRGNSRSSIRSNMGNQKSMEMIKHFTVNPRIMKELPLLTLKDRGNEFYILVDPEAKVLNYMECYYGISDGAYGLRIKRDKGPNGIYRGSWIKVFAISEGTDYKEIIEDNYGRRTKIMTPTFPVTPAMYIGAVKALQILDFGDQIVVNDEVYWQEGEERIHNLKG